MRNVGEIKPERGQPSRNSGQTGREPEEPEEHGIDIDKIWTESLEKARESTQSKSRWPRIPKVPQMLRGTQDFEKFYEPRVISFGPYHYDKPNLHPGEMIKPLYAERFLTDSNQDIKDLYKKIGSKIKVVRDCYDWNGTKKYDDEKLAWMMLLDGCFLLQFIRSQEDDNKVDMSKVLRDHQVCFVVQDLFLLENQLPFGVLKLIFEDTSLSMEKMIKNFIIRTGRPGGSTSKIQLDEEDEEPSHLLDLLRSALLGKYKKGSQPELVQEAEKKGKESSSSGGGNGGSQPERVQEAEKKGKESSSSGGGNGGSQPERVQEAEKKGKESSSSGGGNGGSQPELVQEAEKKGKESSSSGGGNGGSQPERVQEAEKKGKESSSSGGGNGGSQPERVQEAEKKGKESSSSGGGNGGSQPERVQEAEKKGKESSSSGGGNGGSQPERVQEAEKKGKESSSSGGGNGGSQPEQVQGAESEGKGGLCCRWKKGKQGGIWQSFRHIKELKAAGVYLKPSRTSFLRDISFKSYFFRGYLKLPPIMVDDSTKPKFLNIVAYEMCPDAPHDYAVTSYICFLTELIDHADDVKELRSKHILYNCLGSDEDVAKIFNEIADDLVDHNAYNELKSSIQKHYDDRVITWIAEGLHGHFRSPWTFMALIAAVLILILTGIQTYYAHPGKHMKHIYMWLFGVAIFLFLVWYIVPRLWDKLLSCIL